VAGSVPSPTFCPTLERRLPVLADHHERRQEDRFQRHDEKELERIAVGADRPDATQNAKIAACTQINLIEPANAVTRSARCICRSSARFFSW
jgi:hypothetical protein